MANKFFPRLNITFLIYFSLCAFLSHSEEITDDLSEFPEDNSTDTDSSEEFSCNSGRTTEYDNGVCFSVVYKDIKGFDKLLSKNNHLDDTKNINAFMECMSCIAIVRELNKAMTIHNKNYRRSSRRKEIFPCYPDLEEVCTKTFIGYDLQEKKSVKLLAPSSFNGKHIHVPNINWKEKLENLCLLYVSHYGVENMYDDWSTNSETGLIEEICNKSGIFGSCQSIEDDCNE